MSSTQPSSSGRQGGNHHHETKPSDSSSLGSYENFAQKALHVNYELDPITKRVASLASITPQTIQEPSGSLLGNSRIWRRKQRLIGELEELNDQSGGGDKMLNRVIESFRLKPTLDRGEREEMKMGLDVTFGRQEEHLLQQQQQPKVACHEVRSEKSSWVPLRNQSSSNDHAHIIAKLNGKRGFGFSP